MTKQATNCPRCGYDLSGTVATWTKQCPLTGICNECGLEVDWSSVFATSIHPWLFEYHWKRKPFSRFFQTILKGLQPRRFWREVKLTDPVHLKPAALIGLVLVLLAVILLVIEIAVADYQRHMNWRSSRAWTFGLDDIAGAIGDITLVIITRVPGLPATLLAMPLIFALIPTTLRQAKVKSSHVIRIFFYSLIAPLVFACLWSAIYFTLKVFEFEKARDLINPLHWQGRVTSSFLTTLIHDLLPGIVLVIPCTIWMAYWWHQACKQYLKLKETRLIITLLTIVLFLFATMLELVFT